MSMLVNLILRATVTLSDLSRLASSFQGSVLTRRKLAVLFQSRSTDQTPPGDLPKLDLLQWLLKNNQRRSHPYTFDRLAELASIAYVGSTNTTTTTLTNLLIDIAARPLDSEIRREGINPLMMPVDVSQPKQNLSLHNTSKA